jgi:hypothetical protein
MKRLIVLAASLAMAAVLLPGKAAATGNPYMLNLVVSGTTEMSTNLSNGTTNKTEVDIFKSTTMTFNNKYIYNLVSNAVANGYDDLGTNLTGTTLPADGYIAFNAFGTTPLFNEANGVFYVTNKSGFYHPLSGRDATNGYYSFMELDSSSFDFDDGFDAAATGDVSDKTEKGTITLTEPATFYVHDNPYQYDFQDHPDVVNDNEMAIEIRCSIKAALTVSYTSNFENITYVAFPVSSIGTGSGNAVVSGDYPAIVTAGKLTLSQ